MEARQNDKAFFAGDWKERTMGIFNYWRLGLLVLTWWCGWAFACMTFVKLMKEYEMEVSIHLFLRSMVIQMFLPTLLVAAICLAGSMLYWHPTWEKDSKLSIKRRTKQLATNIVK